MVEWIRNVPAGVVPSPSRRLAERPFQPSRAGYGPPAATQQRPARRQMRSDAWVVRAVVASTVISCDAAGCERRSFARFGGQATVRAATSVATSIGGQSSLTGMRAAALVVAASLVVGAAAAAEPARFSATVSPVRWSELRFSYRAGCPVRPDQLRTVRLAYWGFDGRPHRGRLVVNRRVTADVVRVFRRLYAARFPIRRMRPVSVYRGSDEASMAADNTSAFNCRRVVASNTGSWSMHAYGLAIDVNPVENPYVALGRVMPPAGRRYVDRGNLRPGMAAAGGVLVQAFESVGWAWGGRWTGSPDYQHFSTTGR
jgi:hypothetical protein